MELKQELSLKLLPLPLLIQKLDLLALPLLELRQTIEQELEVNPFLEMEQKEEIASELQEESIPDWNPYPQSPDYRPAEEKTPPVPVPAPTFKETLLSRMRLSLNDPNLIRIGEYIIYELDENGYLPVPLKEIASALQEDEQVVENVLHQIQKLAPPGVGAQDLQKCLLIQLRLHPGVPKYVFQLVNKHLKDLINPVKKGFPNGINQEYLKIRRNLGISESQFQTALKWLKLCTPKPTNGFGGQVRHILPDIVIEQKMDEWVVSPTTNWIPKLRLSKEYQTLLKNASKLDLKTNEYLKKKLMLAKLLLEGIEKRRDTLENITKCIAGNILDFLEHKTDSFKFTTLEQIGKDIGRDTSTISRAIKGKWVETPYGLMELKRFFSKGRIKDYLVVKKRIKELVDKEDKTHPLKDGQILKALQDKGAKLARTTVVKYRTQLGIPPAYQRKTMKYLLP